MIKTKLKGVNAMEILTEEQIVMGLILNGGDARSKAIKAIQLANKGNFEEALEEIKQCNVSLNKAHSLQTSIIQAEARGEKTQLSLLMIHGQDHLMNAITVRDLAVEMIELYKQIKKV